MSLVFRPPAMLAIGLAAALGLAPSTARPAEARKTVVVTHAVLGALVTELVGDRLVVKVSIPNGLDPHAWEPSAKDIEALRRADLVVANGLGFEEGMQRALARLRRDGARVFLAADHVEVRKVQAGEVVLAHHHDRSDHQEQAEHDGHADHAEHGEHDERDGHGDHEAGGGHAHHAGHAAGTPDPHLWTDPVAMREVARALARELRAGLGVDLSDRLADLELRLGALDAEVRRQVAALPAGRRKLVTGHESMGYFAQRYGLTLVGAVIPGLSSSAEASAAQLSRLKRLIQREQVEVVFTEIGTPPRVVKALARECGVKAVPITTHSLPPDGSYLTFVRDLARTVTESLR